MRNADRMVRSGGGFLGGDHRIRRFAYGAFVVSGMENALGIAEKGEFTGAAVGFRRGGEFVLGGSAEIVGADNHVAEGIAVVLAGSEIGANQAGSIGADATFFRGSKLRQRLGKTQI